MMLYGYTSFDFSDGAVTRPIFMRGARWRARRMWC